MTNLPTTTKKGTGAPLTSLDEGIARLRSATGRPERRVLFVVCSVHGKGFSFVCERVDPRGRFKVSKPEKIVSSGSASVSEARSTEAAKPETFSPDRPPRSVRRSAVAVYCSGKRRGNCCPNRSCWRWGVKLEMHQWR
jgi:hypothetical protein